MPANKKAMGIPHGFAILFFILPPSAVKSAVMFKPGVVKTSVREIGPVISFEEGAVVFKVEAIMIVPIPCGIIIISIAGEICFDDARSGIIATCIDRCRCIHNGCSYGSPYINPGRRDPETNMCADEDLRITFSSDEAGGYNGGEDK